MSNKLIIQYSSVMEAGVDEAGRGCLAGPVVAAAVILNPRYDWSMMNDSKKLTSKQRTNLSNYIKQHALAWSIAIVDNMVIDRVNILQATYAAMHQAIEKLSESPELILVDGNRFKPFKNIPYHCIVKGDSKVASIAAASILAKTERDLIMQKLHVKYPVYQWDKNKGYGTENHRNAILNYGLSPYHRRSFNCFGDGQLKLEF